jgi:O-antigen/teichoic acid export membrane protein
MSKSKIYNLPSLLVPERISPLSLRDNFSWTFLGNLVYVICQWGMLSVLARLVSPEAVGQFALGLAIATPVFLLMNMQLRQLQATDARREYLFATYVHVRLATSMLGYLVIVGIVLWSGYDSATAAVILALGLARAVESLNDICYGLFQQHEQMNSVAHSMMARGVLALLALALVVLLTGSVFQGVLALAFVWAGILLGHDVRQSRRLLRHEPRKQPRQPRHSSIARLIRTALPLGVVMLLGTLNTTIPRYFIDHYLGTAALGIFAAIAYLMVAGTTIIGAAGQAFAPRLAASYAAAQYTEFRRLSFWLIGGGALLGVAGVLVALVGGDVLLRLLYGAEYARRDVLVGMMLAAGFWYIASCCGFIATASRRIADQPVALGIVVAAVTLLCWWLVPLLGLRGAVLAMIGSSMTGALCYGLLIIPALRRTGAPSDV